jgi:hypothetical protein
MLYRGCGPEHAAKFGLAWTPNINTARLFARLRGSGAAVYAHRAEPGELLLYAHNGPEGDDGYDEYVLDPAYLYSGNVKLVERL